jgi:hypothetical protein
MTRIEKLDALAAKVKSADDLYDLQRYLMEFETASAEDDDGAPYDESDTETELKVRGVDICELPTFGGNVPKSTDGVWSWDPFSLLVGEGAFCDWTIRPRRLR